MSDDQYAHLAIMTHAARLLGRQWLDSDASTGVSRARFFAPPDFANRHGTVHGGFLAAMLDSAASMAILETLADDQSMVTARLDTEFLKPAPLGELIGSARIASRNERDVHIETELATPAGLVVARARATMRIIKRRRKIAAEE